MGLFSKVKKKTDDGVVIEQDWPFDGAPGFVVFDLETTGLSPAQHRVIEIGLIRTDVRGNPLAYWTTLVNPDQRVMASHIHGITDQDVSSAPKFDDCVGEILTRIKGQALVAHNASFDMSFIRAELARSGWELPDMPSVCTMLESRHFLPGLSRKSLSDCAEAVGIDQEVEHRAMGDASITTALFHFYLNGPTNRSRSVELQKLPAIARTIGWPLEKTFPAVPKGGQRPQIAGYVPAERSSSEILERVSELMPEDLLAENASTSEITYGALLLEVLADGLISDDELVALGDCATSMGLSSDTVLQIHRTLLLSLAREAWRDGVVNRNETRDVLDCAARLGLSEQDGKAALKEIEQLRADRVAARTKPLPETWSLGEPLRVGDRVVITGCYEAGRYDMEKKARSLGVRITSAVSGRTTMLVSDGTINGNKDSDAQRLHIRIVGPDDFKKLLEYVQPALGGVTGESGRAGSAGESGVVTVTENLICTKCATTFSRMVTKGRKPHLCSECRSS